MARLKNTLIYSRKAYHSDTEFAKNVILTSKIAINQDHHIALLQEIYPTYKIKPLYTFSHNCLIIEDYRRCKFDSSADAFAAYKCEKQLKKRLQEINDNLSDLFSEDIDY